MAKTRAGWLWLATAPAVVLPKSKFSVTNLYAQNLLMEL